MPQTRWSVFLRSVLTSALAVVLIAVLGGTARAQEPWTISPDGLGPITLGSTLDDVRDALPDPYVLGDEVPIAPDLDGRVVSVDGTVHLLIPSTDSGLVETIIVLDESYQTDEGVGPRSLVGDAEDIYGDARLQWSEEDQGRERATFADGPEGLSFRTSEAVGPQAGIYGDEQTTTVLYDPSSRLTSVWIIEAADDEATSTPADEDATDGEQADEEQDPGDSDESAEDEPEVDEEDPEEAPEEDEPAEDQPEEDEPAEEEPAEEDEPAEEQPAPQDDDAGSSTLPNIDEELAETGVESTTVALAASATVFLGLGFGRLGRRLRPWS